MNNIIIKCIKLKIFNSNNTFQNIRIYCNDLSKEIMNYNCINNIYLQLYFVKIK